MRSKRKKQIPKAKVWILLRCSGDWDDSEITRVEKVYSTEHAASVAYTRYSAAEPSDSLVSYHVIEKSIEGTRSFVWEAFGDTYTTIEVL